jgi:uncharacterized membrane protein
MKDPIKPPMTRRDWVSQLALGSAGLWLTACGGGGSGSSDATNTPPGDGAAAGGSSPATPARTVVVVGHASKNTSDQHARMWRNGSQTDLPDGSTSGLSVATAVALNGSAPLVAGYYPYNKAFHDQAVIWHEGPVDQGLAAGYEGDVNPRALFVDASGVYVAGTLKYGELYKALYWKNGTPTFLSAPTDGRSYDTATGIVVWSGDVFVAGYEGAVPFFPCVWKNGVKTRLSDLVGLARAIHVDNFNTYVAGTLRYPDGVGGTAVLWKNGVAQKLTDGTQTNGLATGVAIGGFDDAYVCGGDEMGSSGEVARLWKNGVPQTLEGAVAGSLANAVRVVGTDVFVAGHVDAGANRKQAALWINGRLTRLGSTAESSTATALAVG